MNLRDIQKTATRTTGSGHELVDLSRSPAWLRIVWLLGLWLLASATAWASSHDLVVERHWYEDTNGTMDLPQVRQQPLRPFAELLTRGYGEGPLWIRLRIDPTRDGRPGDEQRVVLRVRPAYLDEILVYDPLQGTGPLPPMGDRHPRSSSQPQSIHFVQELPAGNAPRDIWLRVRTASARLVYPEVLRQDDYHHSNAWLQTVGALYLGLITVFIAWGAVQMARKPEALMGAFLFNQASFLTLGFCLWGFSYLAFSGTLASGWVDGLTNASIVTASGSGVFFSHFLLKEMGPSRLRSRILGGLLGVFAVLLVAVTVGPVSWALQVNMLLILLVPLLLLGMASWGLRRSSFERRTDRRGLSRRTIWSYFALSALFTMLTALPALGAADGGVYSIYVVFMYNVCSGILMLVLLQYRAWVASRHQARLRSLTRRARASVRQELASRAERERLIEMLGHELKTPLSTMRLLFVDPGIPATMARRLDSLVIDMAHILERSVQASRLETGGIESEVRPMDLAALLSGLQRELGSPHLIRIAPPAPGEAWISSDPALLKIIVRNLIENALKYSPPGSPVDVTVSWPRDGDTQWAIEVSNLPGKAGMPDPAQVFRKYYRSPQARQQAGSGLGLYLIGGLVSLLQGELRYVPEAGRVRFDLRMKRELPGART